MDHNHEAGQGHEGEEEENRPYRQQFSQEKLKSHGKKKPSPLTEPARDEEGTVYDNVHELYAEGRPQRMAPVQGWKMMFDNFSADATRLWEKEGLLIRAEMDEKFEDLRQAARSLAAGVALLTGGLVAGVFASIFVLDLFLPLWASSLIVAAFFFGIGGFLIAMAKKRLAMERLTPRHSLETLGEIKTSIKERVHEFRH